jgi:hypothetical protein
MRDIFQRLYVRTLCRELDLSTLHIESGHLAFFRAAGIALPQDGARFDQVINALDADQLRALAKTLLDPRVVAA